LLVVGAGDACRRRRHAMTILLSAINIGKLFGMRPVLRNVSLEIARGEFVAILGANGAGKTTLLRILATLIRPSAGALAIGAVDALAHPDRARAFIGLVSHQSLIYPDLTARENLEFYGRMYGAGRQKPEAANADGQPKGEIGQAGRQGVRDQLQLLVEDALRRVGLWNRRDDPARTFSRGMIQRLTIARAILHDPLLLLLDEPFTGLDQASAASLSALLREMAVRDRAVVMTTHELGRGLDGVTRALILQGGQITHELRHNITADALTALMTRA
jgi:ABC-type multidrug transport system ATPase subunit